MTTLILEKTQPASVCFWSEIKNDTVLPLMGLKTKTGKYILSLLNYQNSKITLSFSNGSSYYGGERHGLKEYLEYVLAAELGNKIYVFDNLAELGEWLTK